MSTNTTRWNLVVSKETDKGLRQFLANEGRGKKGDLSRFVMEAVNTRIFQLELESSRKSNQDLSDEEAEALAGEALAWARERTRKARE